MTEEFVETMKNMCMNAELTRQEENKESKADKLNEIIKNLCDWMADTKIVIREISFYSYGAAVYARIGVGKNVDGKKMAIDRIFYLGGCCNSQSWDDYHNNIDLDRMLEELQNAKLEKDYILKEESKYEHDQ